MQLIKPHMKKREVTVAKAKRLLFCEDGVVIECVFK